MSSETSHPFRVKRPARSNKMCEREEDFHDGFEKIEIEGALKCLIYTGEAVCRAIVYAPEAAINSVKTYCTQENVLRIVSLCNAEGLPVPVVSIHCRHLDQIMALGDVTLSSCGMITGGRLLVRLVGSAKASLNIQVREMITELRGHAHLKLKGISVDHLVSLVGPVCLEAYEFTSECLDMYAQVSCVARLYTSKAAIISASHFARVYVKGSPQIFRTHKHWAWIRKV